MEVKVKQVELIELFYDLIFVYAISKLTSIISEPVDGLIPLHNLFIYIIALYYLYTYNIKYLMPVCNFTSLLLWLTIIKRFRPLESFFTKIGYYSLQIYLLHFWIIHFTISYLPIIENRWIEFGEIVCIALTITIISITIAILFMKNKMLSLLLFGVITNNSKSH